MFSPSRGIACLVEISSPAAATRHDGWQEWCRSYNLIVNVGGGGLVSLVAWRAPVSLVTLHEAVSFFTLLIGLK